MSSLNSQNLPEEKDLSLKDPSFKNLPLLGKKILVTRPGSQGKDFALKLRGLGAEPILMPMIEISDPDSWHELDSAIASINEYQWLLFASSNAVVSFAKRLTGNRQGQSATIEFSNTAVTGNTMAYPAANSAISSEEIRYNDALNGAVLTHGGIGLPDIAVIGDTTANIANALGFKVNYCPNNFLAEDFVAQFPGYPNNLHNIKILWPRTNYGRDFIAKALKAAGANVHIVAAYKTELPTNAAELSNQLQALINSKKIDAITIASKQTAINLAKIISFNQSSFKNAINLNLISPNSLSPISTERKAQGSLTHTLQDILIVTIGPETSEGALNYLGKVDKEAKQHSADGIINALIEHYK